VALRDGQCARRGEADVAADAMVRRPKTFDTRSTRSDIAAFLADDHVHMALVVANDHRLVTTIERSDLPQAAATSMPLNALGTLEGRTVPPDCPLGEATADMLRAGRRRFAVVDDHGLLLGLLCLKRSGDGFCSDEGIALRAAERASLSRQARVDRGI